MSKLVFNVGHTFKFEEINLEVKIDKECSCDGCFFHGSLEDNCDVYACTSDERSDDTSVIFKKVKSLSSKLPMNNLIQIRYDLLNAAENMDFTTVKMAINRLDTFIFDLQKK